MTKIYGLPIKLVLIAIKIQLLLGFLSSVYKTFLETDRIEGDKDNFYKNI